MGRGVHPAKTRRHFIHRANAFNWTVKRGLSTKSTSDIELINNSMCINEVFIETFIEVIYNLLINVDK